MPKIAGAICNIPIADDMICESLPRSSNSSGVILVKLKKKLSFKGHVYFEPVRPEKLKSALLYLKANNNFYKDIEINLYQIPLELLNIDKDEEIDIELELEENSSEDETCENPLDSLRQGAAESVILPINMNNECIDIAPGEGKRPVTIYSDKNCEELAFPNLFCDGHFGYQVERDTKLSPVKYFNQRLLNYKKKFTSCSDYIFFAQFVLQQQKLNSQINIAMKKISGNLTAGMFSKNFKQTVNSLISSDQGYVFMNQIKGTPAYWKRFQLEVLAMIRQLGCPTFFLTLSCADLRWNELIKIISEMDGHPMSEEQINNLSYFE